MSTLSFCTHNWIDAECDGRPDEIEINTVENEVIENYLNYYEFVDEIKYREKFKANLYVIILEPIYIYNIDRIYSAHSNLWNGWMSR